MRCAQPVAASIRLLASDFSNTLHDDGNDGDDNNNNDNNFLFQCEMPCTPHTQQYQCC